MAHHERLKIGDRVRVSREGGWRRGFLGTVDSDPVPVVTLQGREHFYFVQFDAPQHDLSDDGPYEAAEILGCYLERVEQ